MLRSGVGRRFAAESTRSLRK